MKVKLISVLVVALVAGTVAGQAAGSYGSLTNYIGWARTNAGVGTTTVDMADYLSVYRFDIGIYGVADVMMFENRTPLTADNFANYADRGAYDGSFMHRSIDVAGSGIGVVQGGGFAFGDPQPVAIPSDPPILNEPGISNAQGTIALAKSNGPNTGTNQWYFNTADNTALDSLANNGGYTVFGEVLYDGMDVIGRDGEGTGIASLPTYDYGGPFSDLPFREGFVPGPDVTESDLVMLDSVSQVTGQTYEVVSSSNPGLVIAETIGDQLVMEVTEGMAGESNVTVRVTDGGQSFDAVLKVRVAVSAAMMEANWGQTGLGWEDGDMNGDGVIDNTDLTILATYYYSQPDPPGDPDAVPEPMTCVLLGIGGLATVARRRRS